MTSANDKDNIDDAEEHSYLPTVTAMHDGWVTAMGVRFVRVTKTEVVAELDIGPQHLQPLGIVHGGVYAGLVETVTSIGAGVTAMSAGRLNVGLENHTSFLRAARSGRLRATARPLTQGSRTAVWEATITTPDDNDRIAATGRVRFLILEKDSPLAGQGAQMIPKADLKA